MKKMNQQLQDRLMLQVSEAKTIGLTKLGKAVADAVLHAQVATDTGAFNHQELVEAVQGALWKAACKIAIYHDLPMVDIQKVESIVAVAANELIHSIERSYEVENKVGPFEETVPGQAKR